MDTLRRVLLLTGIATAISLFMYASTAPVITVQVADFSEMQSRESTWFEEGQFLAQLPLAEYVEEKTRDRTITVSGNHWKRFFQDLALVDGGELPDESWQRRLTPDDSFSATIGPVFFRPWEPPLSEVSDQLKPSSVDDQFLSLDNGPDFGHLLIRRHDFSSDDFGLGTGLQFSPRLPRTFSHPFRHHAIWPLIAGLVCYIFLPWQRRQPGTICYAYWRVIAGDVAGLILFVPFFFLPMLINGGFVQCLTNAWFITLLIWPFAGLGAWLVLFMANYAAYQIILGDHDLTLKTRHGTTVCLYREIEFWQPLVLRNPRWLVTLMWVAAFAGKGGQSAAAAGQATMMESMALRGFGLNLRNGSVVYLWVTQQMGNRAEEFFQRVLSALEKEGISHREEIKTIRAIVMPDGEGQMPSQVHFLQRWSFPILMSVPLLAILGLFLVFFVNGLLETASEFTDTGPPETIEAATPGELSDPEVKWEKTYSIHDLNDAAPMLQTDDGGLLIPGMTWRAGSRQYAGAIKTDSEGKVLWKNSYGEARVHHIYRAIALQDGGFLLLGKIGERGYLSSDREISLVRISSDGELLGRCIWMDAKASSPAASDAQEMPDGSIAVAGFSEQAIHILRVKTDVVQSAQSIQLDGPLGEGRIHWVSCCADGGYIATGEVLNPDGNYKDLLLLKLNSSGELDWLRMYGDKRKESGNHVFETQNGHFIAVGLTDSGEGQDAFVVRTDSEGELVWDLALGERGDQTATYASSASSTGLHVVGESRFRPDADSQVFFAEITHDGDVIKDTSDRTVGRDNAQYAGTSTLSDGKNGYWILGRRTLGEFRQDIVLLRYDGAPAESESPSPSP